MEQSIKQVSDYPAMIAWVNHVEPVPRRVRGYLGADVVFDTIQALYVWEWPNYPQYYIPVTDVAQGALVDEQHTRHTKQGIAQMHTLKTGGQTRGGAARVFAEPSVDRLVDTVRFEWAALDHWFEEDEQVFVHPRNPYVRVDALRSTRRVRVELEGVVLAESSAPVMVFETGLPTRYYFNRTEVHFERLEPSETVTECPYKGTTSAYWSIHTPDAVHRDLVWAYDFPTRQLTPIAGLLSFYNERVDIVVDGELLPRPSTHFFK
jgi:uncharacterized protein (DUF427 family)